MDKNSPIVDSALIVAIAAAFLYFVGWVYLYSYLDAFGVQISELDLDVNTVLVYAVPPIVSSAVWLVLAVLLFSAARFGMKLTSPKSYRRSLEHLREIFFANKPLAWSIAALVTLYVTFHLVQWYANDVAYQKWDKSGIDLTAIMEGELASSEEIWRWQYSECANRQALDLVFSDKDSYYLLCKSDLDASSAIVYEVRRDAGLASVRRLVKPVLRKTEGG